MASGLAAPALVGGLTGCCRNCRMPQKLYFGHDESMWLHEVDSRH